MKTFAHSGLIVPASARANRASGLTPLAGLGVFLPEAGAGVRIPYALPTQPARNAIAAALHVDCAKSIFVPAPSVFRDSAAIRSRRPLSQPNPS